MLSVGNVSLTAACVVTSWLLPQVGNTKSVVSVRCLVLHMVLHCWLLLALLCVQLLLAPHIA
jgi:hypothetical protein